MDVVLLIARLVVAGLLLLSGVAKGLESLGAAVSQINAYKLTGRRLATLAAVILPPIEVILGLLILVGIATRPAAIATIGLFLGLAAVMVSALVRGLVTDCGCFGSLRASRVRPVLVIRNGMLALFALLLVVAGPGVIAVDQVVRSWVARLVLVVGLGIVCGAGTFLRYRRTQRKKTKDNLEGNSAQGTLESTGLSPR